MPKSHDLHDGHNFLVDKIESCHYHGGFFFSVSHFHVCFPMTLVKCPGCNKKYTNGRGISRHQRHCVGLDIVGNSRLKQRRRKLAVKLSPQSKKAHSDSRERTNSFQPDIDIRTGGKRKLSVCCFRLIRYCSKFYILILHYLDFAVQ